MDLEVINFREYDYSLNILFQYHKDKLGNKSCAHERELHCLKFLFKIDVFSIMILGDFLFLMSIKTLL